MALEPATALRTSPTPTRARRGLLAVMCACVALVVGMVASINLAVPLLAAGNLHPTASTLVWVVDTYVILFACLVIPGGCAGDRFGRKGVLLCGLVLFTLGCVVSAVAPDAAVLILGRAITGVGAAAVLPNTLAVLLHAVPTERRGATVATWASMSGIGGVLGNVGGGAVLTGGSWRWLFVAGALLAGALTVTTARVAPVSARNSRRLDPAGAVLLLAASVTLLLGIVEGPQQGWTSPIVIGGFVVAIVLFVAWILVELRVAYPLLDPRLFRIAGLRNACIGMTAIFFGMFALFYVNASFLQYAKGFDVLGTGLGIVPISLPIMFGARHVVRLVARIGLPRTVAAAYALVGVGLLGLSTCDASTPYVGYAGWLVVTGAGVTLSLPTLSGVIAGSLPPSQAGVGTGLQATTREFGSALGVAVIATVMTSRFVDALPSRAHGAHTVAAALPLAPAHDVIGAFVAGADSGLRVVGIVVLVVGALAVTHTVSSARRNAG